MSTEPTTSTKEIRIRTPSDFTGDRTRTAKFLQEVKLYLRVNHGIYNTDKKKIIFALSFMNRGTATPWAQTWAEREDLGTWSAFESALKTVFMPIDEAGRARTEMKTLKQGQDLEDYIVQF